MSWPFEQTITHSDFSDVGNQVAFLSESVLLVLLYNTSPQKIQVWTRSGAVWSLHSTVSNTGFGSWYQGGLAVDAANNMVLVVGSGLQSEYYLSFSTFVHDGAGNLTLEQNWRHFLTVNSPFLQSVRISLSQLAIQYYYYSGDYFFELLIFEKSGGSWGATPIQTILPPPDIYSNWQEITFSYSDNAMVVPLILTPSFGVYNACLLLYQRSGGSAWSLADTFVVESDSYYQRTIALCGGGSIAVASSPGSHTDFVSVSGSVLAFEQSAVYTADISSGGAYVQGAASAARLVMHNYYGGLTQPFAVFDKIGGSWKRSGHILIGTSEIYRQGYAASPLGSRAAFPYYGAKGVDIYDLTTPNPFDPPVPPTPRRSPIPRVTEIYQKGKFDIDFSGMVESLWFDGNILLAGDPTNGRVHLMCRCQDGGWNRLLIEGDLAERFGQSVCADQGDVYIGAPYATAGGNSQCGGYYSYSSGSFSFSTIGTPPAGAHQCWSMTASHLWEGSYIGPQLIAGAPGEGAVYFWDCDRYNRNSPQKISGSPGLGTRVSIGWYWAAASESNSVIHVYEATRSFARTWSETQTLALQHECLSLADDKWIVAGDSTFGDGAGQIKVFAESAGSWADVQTLVGEAGFRTVGRQAVIDAGKLYISGQMFLDPANPEILIYVLGDGHEWSPLAMFTQPGDEDFGHLMMAEGNAIAVASRQSVHVFDGWQWADLGRLHSGEAYAGEGWGVSTDGQTLLSGGFFTDKLAFLTRSGEEFVEEQAVALPNSNDYASEVSVFGDFAIVGGRNSGNYGVFVYRKASGIWALQQFLRFSDASFLAFDKTDGSYFVVGGYAPPPVICEFMNGEWLPTTILDSNSIPADLGGNRMYNCDGISADRDIIIVGDSGWTKYSQPTPPDYYAGKGHAVVWKRISGVWTYIGHVDAETGGQFYTKSYTEFGLGTAVHGNWFCVTTADARIYVFEIMSDNSIEFRQILWEAQGHYDVFWDVWMDELRIYAVSGAGYYETSGHMSVWEKDGYGRYVFQQQMSSRTAFEYDDGPSGPCSDGDEIFAGTVYRGYNDGGLNVEAGGTMEWRPARFSQRGSLQVSDWSPGQGAGEVVASSDSWTISCAPSLNRVTVFGSKSGEWIQGSQQGNMMQDINRGSLPLTNQEQLLDPPAATAFGGAAAASEEWLAVAATHSGSDSTVHLYSKKHLDGGSVVEDPEFHERTSFSPMQSISDMVFTGEEAEFLIVIGEG